MSIGFQLGRINGRRLGYRLAATLVASGTLVFAGLTLGQGFGVHQAAATGLLPPSHPSSNIPAVPAIIGTTFTCSGTTGTCRDPCINETSSPEIDTATCVETSLAATNKARGDEGVATMVLPSNWYSLTIPEQIFVITNEERVGRSEDPILGLNTTLDTNAQTGANGDTDPLDSTVPYEVFASNWAGGYDTPLAANFGWMYQDGWGGSRTATSNGDCTSATAPDCWGHRYNILITSTCADCVMGAAYANNSDFASYSELLVRPITTTPVWFSWKTDVVPFLANPITTRGPATPDRRTTPTLPFGYWLLGRDGGIYSFGDARFKGSTGAMRLSQPIVNFAASLSDRGYWLVARDGGVFAFGKAKFYGALPTRVAVDDVVNLLPSASGHGYWIVEANGTVSAFHTPNLGSAHLLTGEHIAAATPTPKGEGYWLVTSNGRVFAFGSAVARGTVSKKHLKAPIVGISPTISGKGYWLVARDGGIFGFGNAHFFGSMGGKKLNKPIVGIATLRNGKGYWLVASDGGLFCFGKARFYGSLGRERLNAPIIAMIGTSKG